MNHFLLTCSSILLMDGVVVAGDSRQGRLTPVNIRFMDEYWGGFPIGGIASLFDGFGVLLGIGEVGTGIAEPPVIFNFKIPFDEDELLNLLVFLLNDTFCSSKLTVFCNGLNPLPFFLIRKLKLILFSNRCFRSDLNVIATQFSLSLNLVTSSL